MSSAGALYLWFYFPFFLEISVIFFTESMYGCVLFNHYVKYMVNAQLYASEGITKVVSCSTFRNFYETFCFTQGVYSHIVLGSWNIQ